MPQVYTWCIHVARWAKGAQNWLKMVPHHFWKNALFTHFGPTFGPKMAQGFFKAFWDLRAAKMAQNRLKMDSLHLFVHPKWSNIIFGETRF